MGLTYLSLPAVAVTEASVCDGVVTVHGNCCYKERQILSNRHSANSDAPKHNQNTTTALNNGQVYTRRQLEVLSVAAVAAGVQQLKK